MSPAKSITDLEWDILQTLAYADIFDYPMTRAEIHRYLIGTSAMPEVINDAIGRLIGKFIADCEGYLCLIGREHIAHTRQKRACIAKDLWFYAERYGAQIGRLPFVRMVTVTGSLAVDNTDKTGDIDFMIITAPKRLWLCRLFVIALVYLAKKRDGVILCPNYFITTNNMSITDRNAFTAREVVQMVPLAGIAVYSQFRALNNWADEYFPNASSPPPRTASPARVPLWKRLSEGILWTPVGRLLERWEMTRKIRKLTANGINGESQFTADMCKGHFDGHRQRILAAYDQRLNALQTKARKAS